MSNFKDIGRITWIDTKTSSAGNPITNFTIAIKRKFKSQSGEYESDFIPCVAFGKQSEVINRFFAKGSRIMVEGTLQSKRYEKDGKTQTSYTVAVESVNIIDNNKAEEQKPEAEAEADFPFDL